MKISKTSFILLKRAETGEQRINLTTHLDDSKFAMTFISSGIFLFKTLDLINNIYYFYHNDRLIVISQYEANIRNDSNTNILIV